MFKKLICSILTVVMLFSAVPFTGAAEEPPLKVTRDGRRVTVSGETEGAQDVVIKVYNPGYSAQSLYSAANKLEAVAYADQKVCNGEFEFIFTIPEHYGDFTVECLYGDTVLTKTISYYDFNSYLVNDDFGNYTGGTPNGWTISPEAAASSAVLGGGYGNALLLSGENNAKYVLQNKISEGGYLLSFDVLVNDGTSKLYLETVDSGGFTYPVLGIDSDGGIGVCGDNSYGEFTAKSASVYERISHIDVFISMEQRCYIVYADSELVAQKNFEDRITSVSGFNFFSRKSANSIIIDNFKMAELDDSYAKYLEQCGISLPAFMEFSTGQVGNIYFGVNDTELLLQVASVTGRDTSFEALVTAVNRESGEALMLGNYKAEINGFEKKDIKIDLADLPFGLFDVTAAVKNDKNTVKCSKTVKVARADKPAENAKNKNAFIQIPQLCNGSLTEAQAEAVLTLADNAGYGGIRCSVYWDVYEKTKGEYILPQTAKQLLDGCAEEGIDVLAVLGFDNISLYPKIVTKAEDEEESINQETLEAFKRYLDEVIDDTSYAATYYEMWNEPDLEMGRNTYAELIKEIYPYAKKKVPNTLIGGGVMSQGTETSRLWCTNEVLNTYGGASYMDAVTVHSYAAYPEQKRFYMDWFWVDDIFAYLDEKISVANATRKADNSESPDLKKWSTEFGWYTSSEGCVDQRTQAEYSVRAYMFLQAAAGVDFSVQHALLDLDDKQKAYYAEKGKELEGYYGVLESVDAEVPFYAKPAFLANCCYNARTAEAELESFSEEDGTYIVQYKKDNRNLYAVWTGEGENKAVLTGLGDIATIYDLYGNKTYEATNNGELEVSVGEAVIYVEAYDKPTIFEINGEKFAGEEYSFDDIKSLGFAFNGKSDEYGDLTKACVFAAYYGKNNVLLDVKKYGINAAANDKGSFSLTEKLDLPADAELVKVFLFQSIENISPLSPACVLKNKEEH